MFLPRTSASMLDNFEFSMCKSSHATLFMYLVVPIIWLHNYSQWLFAWSKAKGVVCVSKKVCCGLVLRGVKDWVHMKTAKMMQDFNCYCNLDVNHKLLLLFIIKVVYLCSLHNKIISPAHFVVYMLWRPTPTWFSNINA